MRRFIAGLCALAAVVSFDATAARAAGTLVQGAHAEAAAQARPATCLGGVLGEGHTGDYRTVADYPAFAALAADLRRLFICGDSIPSFLPSSLRASFNSRRH